MTIEKVDQIEKLTTQPLGSAINDQMFDLYDEIEKLKVDLEEAIQNYAVDLREHLIRKISYKQGTIAGLEIADKLMKSANVSDTLTVLK